jgi:sugar/nucleoside kinase (ribokinase family)
MSTYDVYSFGVVSSSTLYTFKGKFPDPDGYAEFDDVNYMLGGEAANSSIVLSRLGVRVRLDGNWIGDDDAGRRTKVLLDRLEIDSSRLVVKENYQGVSEAVFAAEGTRAIFGSYGRLLEREDWNMPQQEDIRQAKVICLDPFFKEASQRAAEIGFEHSIPVVTIDCLHDDPILEHCTAAVISHNYIGWNYPDSHLEDLFQDYTRATNGLVIFTFGENEIWYGRRGGAVTRKQAYLVDAVDTSGAGDSFRAGIVFGFLNEWEDSKAIDFATAVAGIVCTRTPGVLNAPSFKEVTEFMQIPRSTTC